MKKLVLILGLCSLWFTSCVKDNTERPEQNKTAGLTVDEARTYLENRFGDMAPQEGGESKFFLPPGDMIPQWDQSSEESRVRLDAVFIPMKSSYSYDVKVVDATATTKKDRISVYRVVQSLVVAKQKTDGEKDIFIVSLAVPQKFWDTPEDVISRFLRHAEGDLFTGYVLYTNLEGQLLEVDRLVDGNICQELYASDETAISAIEEVLSAFTFYRFGSIATRGSSEGDSGGSGGSPWPGGGSIGGGGGFYPGGGGGVSGGGSGGGTGTGSGEMRLVFQVPLAPVALGSRIQCELMLSGYAEIVEKKLTLSRVGAINSGVEIYSDFTACMPGENEITATMSYKLSEYGKVYTLTEKKQFYVRFPNRSEIRSMPEVSNAMERAVQMTLDACTETDCTEYGFLIMAYITNGVVNIQTDIVPGPTVPYSVQATWRDTYYDQPVGIPNGVGKYLIGAFHAHPPLYKAAVDGVILSRPAGPSPEDLANTNGVPCFVYDVVPKRGDHSTDDKNLPTQIYDYGPDQRSN